MISSFKCNITKNIFKKLIKLWNLGNYIKDSKLLKNVNK